MRALCPTSTEETVRDVYSDVSCFLFLQNMGNDKSVNWMCNFTVCVATQKWVTELF